MSKSPLLYNITKDGTQIGRLNNLSRNLIDEAEYIDIPFGVKIINQSTFKNFPNLKTVNIPDSVIYIDYLAFYGCSNLKSIIIPNSVLYLGKEAFTGCNKLESIKLSNSLQCINEGLLHNCSSLKEIEIPNSVNIIDMRAFCRCINLETIVIPKSVKYIGNSCFYACNKLSNYLIDSSDIIYDNITVFANTPFERIINKIGSIKFNKFINEINEDINNIDFYLANPWESKILELSDLEDLIKYNKKLQNKLNGYVTGKNYGI